MKYANEKCPCCGNYTLKSDQNGCIGEICEVCFWQSDKNQDINPDLQEGLNPVSLNEAIKNYKKIVAITEAYTKYVRKPKKEEIYKIDYYEVIGDELFHKHSLAAFIFFVERGHELALNYKNNHCLITWIGDPEKSNETVLLSIVGQENSQQFDNVIDLIENGKFSEISFLDAWNECIIIDVY